jgi:predicted outer membrane repeat protein
MCASSVSAVVRVNNVAGFFALGEAGHCFYGGGGAIWNRSGTVTLTNSTVSGNSSPHGGGIASGGTLTLTNSTVSGNSVGGGVYGFPGGGGILNQGTLTLTNSTISGNSVSAFYFSDGGGIDNRGTVTLTNSTVSGNSASGAYSYGGGIDNRGTVTLTNSTVSGNSVSSASVCCGYGGGIRNLGGTVTLTNSTVSGNSATAYNTGGYGGGIRSDGGTVTLTNSTLSRNTASRGGGGIYTLFLALHLDNTLIAGNTASTSGPDVNGSVDTTSGFNLIGDGTGMSGITNGVNGNQVGTSASPINPLLAPLGSYGGPTQTMALLPGSPALDAGSNALRGGATTDQRGYARIVNRTVDIGAFESRGFTVSIASGNHQSTLINTAFAARLRVTVSSPRGEPVAGGVVKFTVPSSGAGAVLSPSMATLDANGHGGVKATANAVAGSYTVAASAGGANAPAHFSLTNNPGAAAPFSLSAPAIEEAGTAFTLTVRALDAFGNAATPYLGTVHLTSTDPLAVLPGNHKFVAPDKGVDTFTVTLNTVDNEVVQVNDTVTHTIHGRKTFTVNAGTPIAFLAPNGVGAGNFAPSLLDVYFAEDHRELGRVFIGGG